MGRRIQLRFCALILAYLSMLPGAVVAWNIPGYMLSGALAYQILRTENPATIAAVKAILEKHPWYDSRWKDQLEKHPKVDHNEMLFMLASSWADEIRTDRAQHRQRKDNTITFEGTVLQIPKTSPFRSFANRRVQVHVMLDGAVEIFYKTEKVAAFDSKTTHTIGLYRTHGKKEGFRYGPMSMLTTQPNRPT